MKIFTKVKFDKLVNLSNKHLKSQCLDLLFFAFRQVLFRQS